MHYFTAQAKPPDRLRGFGYLSLNCLIPAPVGMHQRHNAAPGRTGFCR